VSRTFERAGFETTLRTRLELCKEHKLNDLLQTKFKRGFALTLREKNGFRPYSERINFLNCTSNILPQFLDMVPKEDDTKKGLWTSLTDWIGPNSFDEVNKATRWAQFFSNKKNP
jgi:hypothetical protein